MSKKSNIKWRNSDYKEIRRVVKNYNAKLNRLKGRKDIEPYLPDKVSFQGIVDSVTTRNDLNLMLNRLKRFTRKGSETLVTNAHGIEDIKYNINEFNIIRRTEKARETRELKRINESEVTIANKPTGVKRAEMGKIKDLDLTASKERNDKKFKDFNNQDEWTNFRKLFDNLRNSRLNNVQAKRMLRNYIKGLIAEGYSDELIEMMMHINPNDFARKFNVDEFAQFDFIYDELELKAKNDQLIALWEPYIKNRENKFINMDDIMDEIYTGEVHHYADGSWE